MKKRVLIYGDFLPTGFGRIVQAVAKHLHSKDYEIVGACVQWDGILPLPVPMPFHVCALNGRDQGQGPIGFAQVIANIIGAMQPDVIVSAQDFPYHEALRVAPIDWSVIGHIAITPVDGTPIAEHWINTVPQFDGFLTISEFGVEAFRQQGQRAALCPPGVDMAEFKRLPDQERGTLRDRMGIARHAFVVGVMAMNQGRKDFPSMVRAFAEAYRDVPEAVLYLDCEKISPAGWDIPNMLLKKNGLDPARVKFREDAFKAGVMPLNERYNLLDLHMVIAHREGYGLPHGEALATGCPSIALNYCSGPEVIGDNERGWLIEAQPAHPGAFGTWGGAVDYWPDMDHLIAALRAAHNNPADRIARGARGVEWIKTQRQWSRAAEAVEGVLNDVWARRGDDFAKKYAQPVTQGLRPAITTVSPAGVQPMQPQTTVFHIETVNVNGDNAAEIGKDLVEKVQGYAES